MFKRKFRFIALVAAFMVVVSAFAGCGGTGKEAAKEGGKNVQAVEGGKGSEKDNLNPTGFPIVKNKITVKGVVNKHPESSDWNEIAALNEYEKMTNIDVQWESIPANGFVEKKNLMFASGDLPDFFMRAGLSTTDEANYGSQGLIIPLNDLIEKNGTTFKGIMAKYPEVKKSIAMPDGKIYSLPQLNTEMEPRTAKTWINKKWLDKLGMKVPSTTDELYNALKAFKEKDPNGNGTNDEIPLSGSIKDFSIGYLNSFLGYWGFGKVTGMLDNFIDVGDDGKLRFIATDPKYKEALQYLNKLWSEGLIDKDFFTQDSKKFMAKNDEGTIGYAPGGNNYLWLGAKRMNDFISLPVLKGPYGDQVMNNVSPFVQTTGTFTITNKCKYPEAMMRWVDYLYTKEGTILVRCGVEGVSYDKLPSGEIKLKDFITKNPDGLTLDQALGKYAFYNGGSVPQLIIPEADKSANTMPATIEATKPLLPYVSKEIVRLSFTNEEYTKLKSIQNDIKTYVNEMNVKFITGAEPFENWDSYVNKVKQMRLDDYLKIHESAYSRWKSN